MVEYGLKVHLTQKIRDWAKSLLQGSSQKQQKNNPDEETDENMKNGKAKKKGSDEEQSKAETNLPADLSNPDHGSKKHRARKRKWFRMKGTSGTPDEEKGTENGK